MAPVASIAVVGGSGFYEFLDGAEEVKIDTPFGPPSDPIAVGEVAGKPVAFLRLGSVETNVTSPFMTGLLW